MAIGTPRSRGLWIGIGVLLTPAIVLPLLVPLYDHTDPTLFGFPFYYWFQFALIPVAAVLTFTAFQVSKVADQRDREHRGLPPAADDKADGSAAGARETPRGDA